MLYTVCVIYKLVNVSKPWNTIVTLENCIVKVSLNIVIVLGMFLWSTCLANLLYTVQCMCNLQVNVSKPWNTIVCYTWKLHLKVSLNWPGYVYLAHFTDLLFVVFHLHVNHFTRLSQSCLFRDPFKMNNWSAHAFLILLRSYNLNSEA